MQTDDIPLRSIEESFEVLFNYELHIRYGSIEDDTTSKFYGLVIGTGISAEATTLQGLLSFLADSVELLNRTSTL